MLSIESSVVLSSIELLLPGKKRMWPQILLADQPPNAEYFTLKYFARCLFSNQPKIASYVSLLRFLGCRESRYFDNDDSHFSDA